MQYRTDRATIRNVRKTPAGAIIVEAVLARDGLLQYGDGTNVWDEYRPRTALIDSIPTWENAPVTDDHPQRMVDPSTWSSVARGHVVGTPTVTDPDENGISFLVGDVLIGDGELLKKVDAGKREVSIGFMVDSAPCPSGVAPDGTPCAFIQARLRGNHVAVVDEGRAGAEVRLMLDAAGATVQVPMAILKKQDQIGAAPGLVAVDLPDGSQEMVSSVVAELVAAGMAAMAEQPAAPEAPAPELDTFPPSDESKMDSAAPTASEIQAMVRGRATLERIAVRAGVEESRLDSAECDNDTLARETLALLAPSLDTSKMDSAQLVVALTTASAVAPAKTAAPRQDHAGPAPAPWANLVVTPQPTPGKPAQINPHDRAFIERLAAKDLS